MATFSAVLDGMCKHSPCPLRTTPGARQRRSAGPPCSGKPDGSPAFHEPRVQGRFACIDIAENAIFQQGRRLRASPLFFGTMAADPARCRRPTRARPCATTCGNAAATFPPVSASLPPNPLPMPCSPCRSPSRGAVAGYWRWMAKSPCTAGSCNCPKASACRCWRRRCCASRRGGRDRADQQPLRHSRTGRSAGRYAGTGADGAGGGPAGGLRRTVPAAGHGGGWYDRSFAFRHDRPAPPGWSVLRSRCSRSSPAGGVVGRAGGCDLHRRRHPVPLRCPVNA